MKSEIFSFVASFSFFVIGLDIAIVDFGWDLLMENLNIDNGHVLLLVVVGNIAAAVSSLVAGATANYYGRKKPFVAMGVMLILGSLIKGFGTSSYTVLLIGHLWTSLGIGFAFTIAPIYIAELVPAPSRGFFISAIQILLNTGSLAGYIFHHIISLSSLPAAVSQTTVFRIGAVLSGIYTVCLLTIPESPYWLLMNGDQVHEATEILENSKRSPAETQQIIAEMQLINTGNNNPPSDGLLAIVKFCLGLVWNRDLLRLPLRQIFLSVLGLNIFRQLFGVNFFTADILFVFNVFKRKSTVFFANLGILFARLVFSLVSGLVVDRIGRRVVLFVGISGMCCFLFMSGLALLSVRHRWFQFQDVSPASIGGLCLFGILGILGSFELGLGSVTWIYAAEAFDYKSRAQGVCFGVVINRVADTIRGVLFLYIGGWLGVGGVSLVSVVLMARGIIFCNKFVVEKYRQVLK